MHTSQTGCATPTSVMRETDGEENKAQVCSEALSARVPLIPEVQKRGFMQDLVTFLGKANFNII